MAKLNITVSEALYEQLLDLRAEEHTTINDLVVQALVEFLNKGGDNEK